MPPRSPRPDPSIRTLPLGAASGRLVLTPATGLALLALRGRTPPGRDRRLRRAADRQAAREARKAVRR
jgi:hypothetical protein